MLASTTLSRAPKALAAADGSAWTAGANAEKASPAASPYETLDMRLYLKLAPRYAPLEVKLAAKIKTPHRPLE
jgi:hypothetical protein